MAFMPVSHAPACASITANNAQPTTQGQNRAQAQPDSPNISRPSGPSDVSDVSDLSVPSDLKAPSPFRVPPPRLPRQKCCQSPQNHATNGKPTLPWRENGGKNARNTREDAGKQPGRWRETAENSRHPGSVRRAATNRAPARGASNSRQPAPPPPKK